MSLEWLTHLEESFKAKAQKSADSNAYENEEDRAACVKGLEK